MNTEHIKERIIAYLVDYFVIFFIMTLGLILLTIMTAFSPDMTVEEYRVIQQLYMYVSLWLISLSYFSIFEWKKSTTLGKMMCIIGIKDESGEGDNISFKQSLTRNWSKFMVEIMIIDLIIGLYKNPSKVQRAGEIWSKTSVVEIPDPMRLNTKQARKVRRVFKIVMAIGGALLVTGFILSDFFFILGLIV